MISLILLSLLLFCFYKFSTKNYKKWEQCGVPFVHPLPLIGNLLPVILKKSSFGGAIDMHYKMHEGHRFCGFFNMTRPTLILRDLELINIFLKTDFSKATWRGIHIDAKRDPISVNLFNMEGITWKTSREKLRAGFKPSQLKGLIPSLDLLSRRIIKEIKMGGSASQPVKTWTNKFTGSAVAGPIMGLDVDSIDINEFVYHCNQAFNIKDTQSIRVLLRFFLPEIALKFGIQTGPTETVEYFSYMASKVEAMKDHCGGNIAKSLADYILLVRDQFIKEKRPKDFLDAIVKGQFFIFAIAGYDTTSCVLSFTLYFLSKYKNILKMVREEVKTAIDNHGGQICMEALKEMTFLEKVIYESMRMYPPIPAMMRVLNTECTIPNCDFVLNKGDAIVVPIISLHRDPRFYEEPDKFDPFRFDKCIPEGAFIPFGFGPRICIGMQLAMIEMKIFLSRLILDFNVEIDTAKTPEPLELDPESMFSEVKSGIWINFLPNNDLN